jgi:phenylalanyl-tRNA synthetase beta chain
VKLSFDWLCDYVDLSGISPQEVADKLTMGAFEVEEVHEVGGGIKGEVVVGEILDIKAHPDADKIRVTSIRLKEGADPVEIVCGAWNIEVGHRIPVALPGSLVINRHDGSALEIKQSKIRGVVSNGMLCSPPELGVVKGDGEGILLLEKSTKLGTDVKELLGLQKPDYILHVEPRSNRGDALSVIGLAREVAALCQRPLKEPHWKLPAPEGDRNVPVHIENTEDCPFFTIRVISGIKVGPSPAFIARRLEAIGMRTVNNIVDITNYVMQELGQPLHAYDIEILNGPYLETRRGRSAEKLVTIDERERQLTDEVMVIADKKGVVGIAGVMGGKGSEISDSTTTVALEAAAFNSARVRRSSRLLGLSSDSSLRFERGVDIASVRKASDRAAYLMVEHAGGKLGAFTTAGDDKVKPVTVSLRMSEVARLTEIDMTPQTVSQLLQPLGFEVKTNGSEKVEVGVPSFRQKDVSREVDLVEEVCRLYGYDKVPPSMPRRTIAPPVLDTSLNTVRAAISAAGMHEAWISSLVGRDDLTGRGAFEDRNEGKAIHVLNPLSEDHQVLRQSLIPGLIKAVAYNQDHGRSDVWLYEIGRTYELDKASPEADQHTGTVETQKVGGIICGHVAMARWHQRPATEDSANDFFMLKGIVQNLLHAMSVPEQNVQFRADPEVPSWYHPSRSAAVEATLYGQGKPRTVTFGWIGVLHPAVGDTYGLKKGACIFELNLDALKLCAKQRQFEEIYTTPPVVRDLTVDVPKEITHAAVEKCIVKTAGKLLREVELVSTFDLSETQKISLSYRLIFQDPKTTLTADQVEQTLTTVRAALSKELSATFRT